MPHASCWRQFPPSIAIVVAHLLLLLSQNCLFCSAEEVINATNITNPSLVDDSATNLNDATAACDCDEKSSPIPPALQWVMIVVLVIFSAMFSGLTLGLMSLDPSGLEIVMANSDDPKLARAAKAIYPVRVRGNLLLCTLLLGNVTVNSGLSIVSASIFSGLIGLLVSTGVITIFGEIIPQAICCRYGLQIGEATIPLVKILVILFYPICKPLSWVLDKVLGREIGTTYSSSEMTKLIEMHVQRGEFHSAAGAAMKGALRYHSVTVNEVMTPLINVFMLSADERLGFDVVARIFKTGYSRIPVYEVSKSNIVGLLFVKDLIFLDPEDEIPVKNFVHIFGRALHFVWADDNLGDVLKLLKSGRSHMAVVQDVNQGDGGDPFYEVKGIITLEDILELILGDEIVDETDELVDVNDPNSAVSRASYLGGEGYEEEGQDLSRNRDSYRSTGVSVRSVSVDWQARLRLLDERLVDEHLSPEEVRAVAAHLKTNYPSAVELTSDRQLKELLSTIPVSELPPAETCHTASCNDDDFSGVPEDKAELLYERGVPADFCTIVLSGKIMVMSGADRFRSDVSNWGVLATRALIDPSYVPDFTAWVLPNSNQAGGCRCVKIDRSSFAGAVDNTAIEKTGHNIINSTVASNSAVKANLTSPLSRDEDVAPDESKMQVIAEGGDDTRSQHGDIPSAPLSPPTTPSRYVRTNDQQKTHSRRSKLLKAFTQKFDDGEIVTDSLEKNDLNNDE
mmetsp:Transcript_12945/g.19982  ORF Transcript_12945/g.19982 Transcript_12945/m.19982 type:complete len:737 (-) Transcript_12945:116-2326(-)